MYRNVASRKVGNAPGVSSSCHKRKAPTSSLRVRDFLVGAAVLTSLQQELNRIQLLISYILTQVRPMPAGKNRGPASACPRQQIEGAPGLAFETWDPHNRS